MGSTFSMLAANQKPSDHRHEKYHTVPIRSELAKIPKAYQDESPHQLPSENFWVEEVERSNTGDARQRYSSKRKPTAHSTQYKLLYAKANGPCESSCLTIGQHS